MDYSPNEFLALLGLVLFIGSVGGVCGYLFMRDR